MKLSRRELFKNNPGSLLKRFMNSDQKVGYKIQSLDKDEINDDIALVITVNGMTPYIHLHLESWRRNYPHIKLLVYDYSNQTSNTIENLCNIYGASYYRFKGSSYTCIDMQIIYDGLKWGKRNDCGIVVKFSHDFIPLFNWIPEFNRVHNNDTAPTFTISNINLITHNIKCIGFRTDTWLKIIPSGISDALPETIMNHLVHNASELLKSNKTVCEWSLANALISSKYPHVLSNNSCDAIEYCRALIQYGYVYRLEDWYLNG